MKKVPFVLPADIVKGLVCDVRVTVGSKSDVKRLKICTVKARSITFMEVDKANRKNIFRKVKLTDIESYNENTTSEFVLKNGVLPTKWESSWDSIGQVSQSTSKSFSSYVAYSKHSKGWAPKLPSTTNNPVSGFPMV